MRVLLLLVLLIHSVHTENLYIKCCDIWTAVHKFVRVSTSENAAPCPVPCKTYPAISKFIMNISPRIQHHDDARNGSWYYVAQKDIFSSEAVSDVLAWSIIGRMCSAQGTKQEQGKFMQFDPGTGEISIVHAGCEYQRSLYSTMLGLCIVVIIFTMAGLVVKKTPETNSTQLKDTAALNSKCDLGEEGFMDTNGIFQTSYRVGTRSDVRYRPLI